MNDIQHVFIGRPTVSIFCNELNSLLLFLGSFGDWTVLFPINRQALFVVYVENRFYLPCCLSFAEDFLQKSSTCYGIMVINPLCVNEVCVVMTAFMYKCVKATGKVQTGGCDQLGSA